VCDVNLRRTTGGVLAGEGPRPSNAALEGEQLAVFEAVAAADLIKVNDRELDAIARWLGWADPIASLRDRRQPARASSADVVAGGRIVVVTHGAEGSTLHGDGPPIAIPGVRAPPGGDNVGCGDAYLAILVLGMTMGWDLEASGRAASRYAAAVAGMRGATPRFTDEQIAELLEPA
jgi:fructokinase